MTNSEKLRILADWLDARSVDNQIVKYEIIDITELANIQNVLRQVADQIEE